MMEILTETALNEHENQALNFPARYLRNLSSKPPTSPAGQHSKLLFRIMALYALGDFRSALAQLNKLRPQAEEAANHLMVAKLNLIHYQILSNATQNSRQAEELLQKAVKAQRLLNAKSLECDILLARSLARMNDFDLTHTEDILHKAMGIAVEADDVAGIIRVYLAFIYLYHSFQLPDPASRELQMLQEICAPQTYPFYNVQMQNHRAINSLMLQNYPQAETSLQEGISLADKQGYKFLASSLMINQGLLEYRNNHPQAAIELYRKAYGQLTECAAEGSTLAEKALHNLAQALGIQGETQSAAAIYRDLLSQAKKQRNRERESVICVNFANALIELEEWEAAESMLKKAIEYFTNTKNYGHLQKAWLCRARMYETQGQYQQAFECMEELYRVTQLHFRENCNRQAEKLTRRINDLRKEYVLIRSRCGNGSLRAETRPQDLLVGEHPQLKKALDMAMQAAKYPYVNVLISGETGTGKEIVARIVHGMSVPHKPMIAVNASAIPPNLMESELFGHVKGAFTGAISDHKGKFLLADKSTLFLDEISEMPLDLQAKLLRVIEHGCITPVGSDKEIPVQCRIICATNKKLSLLIQVNQFRLDLFHRLNKIEIQLPPLRDRLSDLRLLTDHFVERCASEFGLPVPSIADSFFARLRQYHFPGNIRELINIIERIFILKPKLTWDDTLLDGLVEDTPRPLTAPASLQADLDQTEYQIILMALQKSNWVQKEAAKRLGMTESTLSRHIKRLGISK